MLLTIKRDFFTALRVCSALNSHLLLPKNQEEMDRAIDLFVGSGLCGYRMYIGAWDLPQEGNWTNANNGKPLAYNNVC